MAKYSTTYKRMNCGFTPVLVETKEIIFETNIPFENESLDKFEEFAWKEFWKQTPEWKDFSAPEGSSMGWSSVTGGNRFVKIPE